MITHWEEFKLGPTVPVDERLHATIDRKGIILLNGNIHDRLGNPEAVILLFDRVNSIIGINPVSPSVPNAFKLKFRSRGRHRMILAIPFCRHYGISVDHTTIFADPQIGEDGVLRLDLKATTRTRRRRTKSSERTK